MNLKVLNLNILLFSLCYFLNIFSFFFPPRVTFPISLFAFRHCNFCHMYNFCNLSLLPCFCQRYSKSYLVHVICSVWALWRRHMNKSLLTSVLLQGILLYISWTEGGLTHTSFQTSCIYFYFAFSIGGLR